MRGASVLIVVFAKAPQAGRVKTRLGAAVGAQAAARLHARLVERTLAVALEADCGTVELHGSPAGHSALQALARRHRVPLRGQAAGDIGRRMHEAFKRGLRRHARVILIGSDCPALSAGDLRRAARLLRSCCVVIAPAEDGGYPLIGLARNSLRIFEGIAWSTPSVMEQTRLAMQVLGWRWKELRTLWDIDRPEDLSRLDASGLMRRRRSERGISFGPP